MFTLTVNINSPSPSPSPSPSGPTVNFDTASVTFNSTGSAIYDQKAQLDRSGDTSNALTVYVGADSANIEGDTQVTFNAGENTATFNYWVHANNDLTEYELTHILSALHRSLIILLERQVSIRLMSIIGLKKSKFFHFLFLSSLLLYYMPIVTLN